MLSVVISAPSQVVVLGTMTENFAAPEDGIVIKTATDAKKADVNFIVVKNLFGWVPISGGQTVLVVVGCCLCRTMNEQNNEDRQRETNEGVKALVKADERHVKRSDLCILIWYSCPLIYICT
mmetsp:Transcript_6470/g.12554  ORF Transcript_6470/g.12554 Transcript_6470/m.12554 type:complete len:122 (+) Transcript_6470:221-586(+)